MGTEAIRVKGLKEFQKSIKEIDKELPKALRVAFNKAADLVTEDAKKRVPTRSGKAARSIKSRSTQVEARVVGGAKSAPYYPWLDFGGKVGRKKSINRPYKKRGRYLYAAYFQHRDSGDFQDALLSGIREVAADAGLELD